MNDSRKTLRILLIVDLALVLGIGFGTFWLLNKHDSTMAAEQELEEEKAKLASIQSIDNMLTDTKDTRGYLASLFVDKASLVDFLESLESVSAASHAKISVGSVTFAEDSGSTASANSAKVSFTAKGSWAEVSKTIEMVDHLPMAAMITNVQIVKEEQILDQTQSEIGVLGPEVWSATFEIMILKNQT